MKFYCDVLCSPEQYKYVTPVGYENRTDTMTGGTTVVEVIDIKIDMNPHFLCGLYDSCKSIRTARLMPSLGASSLNFMNYQSEGAVSMGVYFIFNYTEDKNAYDTEYANCWNYTDPDTGETGNCGCISCQEMCEAEYSNHTETSEEIKITDGVSVLGLCLCAVVAALLIVAIYCSRRYLKCQIKNPERKSLVKDLESQQVKQNSDFANILQYFFNVHAYYCSHHPYLMMSVPIVICIGLSVGMLFLKIESDPNQIWVDENSVIGLEAKHYHENYGPYYRQEQALFSFPYTHSCLTKENLLEFFELQKLINNTKASDGTILDDICYKPIRGKGCAIQSPMNYWQANETKVIVDKHLGLTPSCVVFEDGENPCVSEIGAPCQKDVVWGWKGDGCDDEVDMPDKCSGSCAPRPDRFVMAIMIENNENVSKKAEIWEKDVYLKILREQQEKYEVYYYYYYLER